MADKTYALLGDLESVPAEYKSQVAQVKRVLEVFTMDPAFRDGYQANPEGALASLGVDLAPADVAPLVDPDQARRARELLAVDPEQVPPAVRRHWAFVAEKLNFREAVRQAGFAASPGLAKWRQRQLNRACGELGTGRSSAIVHAPFAVELSKGCTVGCWFCGVAAPKYDEGFSYTAQNAALWRGCLTALHNVFGTAATQGFLYWATDPLDNPDYEAFREDFFDILKYAPQTTTAQGPKDLPRTRALLERSAEMGIAVDRFSIIALNHLRRLHEEFTPEEVLRVEFVPQNKESDQLKSRSGRALNFAEKRAGELVDEAESSTIACVTGFLINMVDRRVRLITPCNTSKRWPLGYWVLDEEHFDTAEEFERALRRMIDRSVHPFLERDTPIRVRRDISLFSEDDSLVFEARGLRESVRVEPDCAGLLDLIADGSLNAEHIAGARRREADVPLAHTYALLGKIFDHGLLDEEPPPRSFEDVMRKPTPVQLGRRQPARD
ncbi:radical SAM family RiPP maturation amino acid epimerase [Flexivirga meconopsidis]|uniref:radical SAM family RiPP maturation amino acid epimerase n=1 Tax=Flexivirga meconopsidis TaxID=2977121 RepID=UPI00223F2E48|nr:radical SAM family RiPP maturation amino acid epimerase [Flexivirga meconopsidis]